MDSSEKIIKSIRAKKRSSKCIITFRNGDIFECSQDLVVKYGLHTGMIINPELDEKVTAEQHIFDVKQSALAYVSYKSRTIKQVKDKLRLKDFSVQDIDLAIRFLKDFNYLDDERYARAFVKDYLKRKSAAGPKLMEELWKRGINKDLAKKVIAEEFPYEDTYKLAMAAAEKKLRTVRNKPEDKQRSSVTSYLQRLGFRWEVIKEVLKEIFKKEE